MNDKLIGWSDQDQIKENYFNICNLAAENDDIFNSFKKNSNYTTILEHVSYDLGLEYSSLIMEYSKNTLKKIFKNLDEIKKNDLVGSPFLYNYDYFGVISPTTLRYIKVLADIIESNIILDNKNIVEIGGGYGGQCLVLSKIFNFNSYTILDLESVNKLQSKYLKQNSISNVKCKTINDIDADNFDFVISNYAFAELNKNFQNLYINKVIKNSKGGYFQINPDASECYSREELINIFKEYNNSIFLEDKPMNKRYPNNFIFIFGER